MHVVLQGSAESCGPAPSEAVYYSSGLATVSQLLQPGSITLTDLEADEATYAGRLTVIVFHLITNW